MSTESVTEEPSSTPPETESPSSGAPVPSVSENREAIPMVTRLKYTVLPASRFDPTRDLGNGQYEGVMTQDTPGMVFGITPFICGKVDKERTYEFKDKAFWEGQLAALTLQQSKQPTPNPSIAMAIDKVALMLATNKLWLADLFSEAGISDLSGSWASAFSTSLDEFPTYVEPSQQIGGLPYVLKQIRWDARLPYLQPKQIEVTIGMYPKFRMNETPVEDKLVFEDGATLRNRQARELELNKRIVDMGKLVVDLERIVSLLALPQTEETLRDLEAYNPQYVKHPDLVGMIASQRDAIENANREAASLLSLRFGVLSKLMGHANVTGTIKQLCMAGFKLLTLHDPEWAGLSLATMDALFQLPDVS